MESTSQDKSSHDRPCRARSGITADGRRVPCRISRVVNRARIPGLLHAELAGGQCLATRLRETPPEHLLAATEHTLKRPPAHVLAGSVALGLLANLNTIMLVG